MALFIIGLLWSWLVREPWKTTWKWLGSVWETKARWMMITWYCDGREHGLSRESFRLSFHPYRHYKSTLNVLLGLTKNVPGYYSIVVHGFVLFNQCLGVNHVYINKTWAGLNGHFISTYTYRQVNQGACIWHSYITKPQLRTNTIASEQLSKTMVQNW